MALIYGCGALWGGEWRAPDGAREGESEMSDVVRGIQQVMTSRATIEGAGVHLRRAFGPDHTPLFDPFLMLDDFRSDKPEEYREGFPWHPHRGIETITYMLQGEVEHADSLGNKGVIGPGDVQWMTAGSGIIHQEMPRGDAQGRMGGLQLWANLPAAEKMRDPRYQGFRAEQIPEVTLEGGVRVRVIAGEVGGQQGPVQGIAIAPEYLDVRVPAGARFAHPTGRGRTVFAYVLEGSGRLGPLPDGAIEPMAWDHTLVLFGDGDRVLAAAGDEALRFLLISGEPLREPIAWYGPVVMNTEEELRTAFDEYRRGTFVKQRTG